jgi:acetoin:2,6-dichlorophenolindophenol oxidoreductase subunit beta
MRIRTRSFETSLPEITYIAALREAMAMEMRADPRVHVIGEDVAEGGPFGATKGLADEFGAARVRNTPISEGTVMGIATGMALAGLRPVFEVMFIDFLTLAIDQLVNQAAKARYMSGGQLRCPLVVRTAAGAGRRYGAQHSQSLEAWLAHVPGLKVAMPATAADAAGLLRTAIRDEDPCVIVEAKLLYYRKEEAGALDPVPFGRAVVRRAGRDATVIATARMVGEALLAAEELAREGIAIEVIDPRTLVPLDLETITASVRRTGCCVIAHEAPVRSGFGAEIAALVQEHTIDALTGPVLRVGAPDAPVPAAAALEDAYMVGAGEIVDAVRGLVGRAR